MEQIAPNTLQALSLKGDLGRGGFSSGNVYLKMGRKNFPPSQPNLPQGSQDTQNFAQGAQNAQDAQNTEGDQGTQDDQAQDTEKPSNIFHDMSLALKIGMMLGQGHSGVVFDVSPDTEDGFTSTDLPESAIPPLVVKIARHKHEVDIDREA
ncbi:hypothetical protein OF83DRAFT_1180425 [Amylostereum chailletii]|nr:hypothetical protein OF83DRAFT_1180425 [Amylostereum chailletii]